MTWKCVLAATVNAESCFTIFFFFPPESVLFIFFRGCWWESGHTTLDSKRVQRGMSPAGHRWLEETIKKVKGEGKKNKIKIGQFSFKIVEPRAQVPLTLLCK